jgi:F0F1-type ATP synthase epsilon subunit
MKLNIISLNDTKHLDINWIEIMTENGNFIVQKNHAPLIATLKESQKINIQTKDGSNITQYVKYGIVKIERDTVDLIIG